MQREILLVEPSDLLHVRGTDQASIEAVRPRVIRALNRAGELARRRRADARPAMPADVEQASELTITTAHDDDRFTRDFTHDVVARSAKRACASHTVPQ